MLSTRICALVLSGALAACPLGTHGVDDSSRRPVSQAATTVLVAPADISMCLVVVGQRIGRCHG